MSRTSIGPVLTLIPQAGPCFQAHFIDSVLCPAGDVLPPQTNDRRLAEFEMPPFLSDLKITSHFDSDRKTMTQMQCQCDAQRFTAQAKARWDCIPEEYRQKLLSNVYCTHCRDSVTITNYTGTVRSGDLLLVASVPCAEPMWRGWSKNPRFAANKDLPNLKM